MEREKRVVYKEEEISLVDLLNIMKKHIKLILGVFFIVAILGVVFGSLKYKNGRVEEAIISYNFNEINLGQNPNGTDFDYSEMTSTKILAMVEEELRLKDYGITRIDLLKNISITPMIPNHMAAKIETDLKNGLSTRYIATSYKVSLKLLKNPILTQKILESLINNYTHYYKNNYKSTVKVGELDDLSDLSYLEVEKVLKTKISELERKVRVQKDQNFMSKRTGLGFSNIVSKASQFRNINLARLDRMILLDGITRDKKSDLSEIDHEIYKLKLSKSKEEAHIKAINEVLENYKLTPNTILSSENNNNIANGDNSNIKTYSKLNEDLIKAKGNIASILNETNTLELKKTQIKNSKITEEPKQYVNNLTIKASELIMEANSVLDDYNNQFIGEYVSQVSPVKAINTSKGLLIILGSLVLGLILGVLLAFVKEFLEVAKVETKLAIIGKN